MCNAPVVPPLVPAPAPFLGLGPGHGNTILDYSNPSHVKSYYEAIAPFGNKFNGKPLIYVLSCKVYQTMPRILGGTTFYALTIRSGLPGT